VGDRSRLAAASLLGCSRCRLINSSLRRTQSWQLVILPPFPGESSPKRLIAKCSQRRRPQATELGRLGPDSTAAPNGGFAVA
jgi:hypothetical protein